MYKIKDVYYEILCVTVKLFFKQQAWKKNESPNIHLFIRLLINKNY